MNRQHRSWFRLHTSTWIALVVVFCILLYKNVILVDVPQEEQGNRLTSNEKAVGWPLDYYYEFDKGFISTNEILPWDASPEYRGFMGIALIIDILLSLMALFLIGYSCEQWERKKGK